MRSAGHVRSRPANSKGGGSGSGAGKSGAAPSPSSGNCAGWAGIDDMPTKKAARSGSKPRVADLIPYLRGFRGWVTFVEGAIHALQKYVEPVLIVSRGDQAAAAEKFPHPDRHVLPTVQAEEWSGTTLSMLRWMIPSVWAARALPDLRVRLW